MLHALLDPARGTLPRPFRAHTVPADLQAVDYDLGTQGFAYFDRRSMRDSFEDNRPWNSGWSYRNDGVDIEPSQDPPSDWNLGWIEDGEWLQFTLEVTEAGVYDVELRVATPQTGGRVLLRWNGVPLPASPLVVPRTGGWQSWTSIWARDLPLQPGTYRLRVEFPVGGFNLGRLRFTRH
ncbi:MAG: hypothetical protein Kow001_01370 [Acidobacteriota bacterium]